MFASPSVMPWSPCRVLHIPAPVTMHAACKPHPHNHRQHRHAQVRYLPAQQKESRTPHGALPYYVKQRSPGVLPMLPARKPPRLQQAFPDSRHDLPQLHKCLHHSSPFPVSHAHHQHLNRHPGYAVEGSTTAKAHPALGVHTMTTKTHGNARPVKPSSADVQWSGSAASLPVSSPSTTARRRRPWPWSRPPP